MLYVTHWLVLILYAAAPVAALGYALVQARRQRLRPLGNLMVTVLIGSALGTAGTMIYGVMVGGRVGLGQFFEAIYLAIAVLLVLKGFDWLVMRGLRRLIHRPTPQVSHEMAPEDMPHRPHNGLAVPLLMAMVRAALLIGIGLPYVLSAAMTFRPKVVPRDDPMTLLGLGYTAVSFESTDAMSLSGWWIPATLPQGRGRRFQPRDFGAKTVIICHGLLGNKASDLALARQLVPAGYNVLVFDFRAHGESSGHFTSYGDLERNDVLGAVQWLRLEHPEHSQRIVGVGVDTGGAALIAAAADPSPAGQAISAIAVYDTYDDLQLLAAHFSRNTLLPPMDWLAQRVGLRLASVQVGANLVDFSPAALTDKLWPRPILIIHATYDTVVPFERGMKLFERASFPKQSLWIGGADQRDAVNDDGAASTVRSFFDTAHPMPII